MNSFKNVVSTGLKALGAGAFLFFLQRSLDSNYLSEFLRANLLVLLFALLAINAATLGVVLTKMRDLLDEAGEDRAFAGTRSQMLLSIREQVGLIVVSLITLIAEKAPVVAKSANVTLAIQLLLPAFLAYALFVLYDTCKSVFVILDFKCTPPQD